MSVGRWNQLAHSFSIELHFLSACFFVVVKAAFLLHFSPHFCHNITGGTNRKRCARRHVSCTNEGITSADRRSTGAPETKTNKPIGTKQMEIRTEHRQSIVSDAQHRATAVSGETLCRKHCAALVLVIVTVLVLCAQYDRWTQLIRSTPFGCEISFIMWQSGTRTPSPLAYGAATGETQFCVLLRRQRYHCRHCQPLRTQCRFVYWKFDECLICLMFASLRSGVGLKRR